MAYRNIDNWKPHKKTLAILDRAMEHVSSVPYQVSARWLFYRVWQDGMFPMDGEEAKAKAYSNFIQVASRARHSGMWPPDLLADETREMTAFSSSGDSPEVNIDSMVTDGLYAAREDLKYYEDRLKNYRYECDFSIDPWYMQDYYTVIMFEARAMFQQFATYTKGLTLCPFGGQPSIPYKFEIATYLERKAHQYGKTVVVLYFGDLDDSGEKIYQTAQEDITKWCSADVRFVRCGLTREQVDSFGLEENPEKPGYQWEALNDEQARSIINEALPLYYNSDVSERAQRQSEDIREQVEEAVADAMEN